MVEGFLIINHGSELVLRAGWTSIIIILTNCSKYSHRWLQKNSLQIIKASKFKNKHTTGSVVVQGYLMNLPH